MVLGEEVGHKIHYVEIIDSTPPLMAVTDGVLDFFFGRSLLARHILALVILFFQAAYFAILLINNRAYNENTYVPALLFGILTFFSHDTLSVTPELMGSTILLLALNNLFREIEFRTERDSIVLNLGVFLGLASLFYFPYAIYLPFVVVLLVMYARPGIRRILLMLFGFLLIHLILITFYYWYDSTEALWNHFYLSQFRTAVSPSSGWSGMLYPAIFPLTYFVFSLFMLTREARFSKYQSQLFQVIFGWLIIGLIVIAITGVHTPHDFIIVIPPFTYFISYYLLLIRRRWIANWMFWLFFFGVVGTGYAIKYGYLSGGQYPELSTKPSKYLEAVKQKKVMILADDPGLYLENHLGGYFLDWQLSEKIFLSLDNYKSVEIISQAVQHDNPDVILDPDGRMPELIRRIPLLEKQYRAEGALYIRTNN